VQVFERACVSVRLLLASFFVDCCVDIVVFFSRLLTSVSGPLVLRG
jgi:hypothetical protein